MQSFSRAEIFSFFDFFFHLASFFDGLFFSIRELVICILAYSQFSLLFYVWFSSTFLISCKVVFSIIVFLFLLL